MCRESTARRFKIKHKGANYIKKEKFKKARLSFGVQTQSIFGQFARRAKQVVIFQKTNERKQKQWLRKLFV